MRPLNGLSFLPRVGMFVAVVIALTSSPATAQAPPSRANDIVKVLVPAYFYPTWWAGSPWEDLNCAASEIPIEAIMNPANGPGLEPNPDYMMAVADLRESDGKVIGYVSTAYGSRAFEEVIQDIHAYFAWYDVDGIFLDEMGNQFGNLDYASVFRCIKSFECVLGRKLRVVGNAGMPFPQVEVYMNVVDTLVIFEGPQFNPDPWGASFDTYPIDGPYAGLPLWFQNYRPKQLASLVYGVSSADAMIHVLDKARQYRSGYVFITDDDNTFWNPWDTLPTYWDQEVRAIKAINTSRKQVHKK